MQMGLAKPGQAKAFSTHEVQKVFGETQDEVASTCRYFVMEEKWFV